MHPIHLHSSITAYRTGGLFGTAGGHHAFNGQAVAWTFRDRGYLIVALDGIDEGLVCYDLRLSIEEGLEVLLDSL